MDVPETLRKRIELVLAPGAFRLVLALVVFVAHVSRFNIGRPAVLLFFMLSGFWVTRAYDRSGDTIPNYLVTRWLRVWPLLALVTITWFVVMPLFGLVRIEGPLSTLATFGLASRQHALMVVAWSLDIELQFYVALPFVLMLAAKLDGRVVALFVAVAFVGGVVLVSKGVWTLLAFAPVFAAGVAIERARWRPSTRTAALSAGSFAGAALVMAAVPSLRFLIVGPDKDWLGMVGHSLWTLLLTPAVAWVVRRPSTGFDRTLGNLSYPFYLVHLPVLVALAALPVFSGGGMAVKVAALAASVVLTIALYVLVDRPLEQWRHRMRLPELVPQVDAAR